MYINNPGHMTKMAAMPIILARSDDISSRSLAFDALNYGI